MIFVHFVLMINVDFLSASFVKLEVFFTNDSSFKFNLKKRKKGADWNCLTDWNAVVQ